MKPAAAAAAMPALVLIALVLGGLLGVTPVAAAQRSDVATPELRLDLASMTPRVVTTAGPPTLTITGTITNTGPVPVDQVVVRVQRGAAVDTAGELRDALEGNAGTDVGNPQFTPVIDELAAGQRIPVTLSVPLRGGTATSLALTGAGVYELLVNVNGVPRDGVRARLAAVRLLLPVLTPPPAAAGAAATVPPVARPTAPTPFTMLYPIVDTPHRLSTVPGARPLLTDDRLAGAFAPGGRLSELVSALARQAPPESAVRAATCVAVDPDLLQTAEAMRGGYDVLGDGGPPVPGTGGPAASQWLSQLSAAARGGCVLALPFADADLVALTRGGLGDAAATAITGGRQVVSDLLGTPTLAGVTWPAGGVVDPATLGPIADAGGRSLLLSAEGVERGRVRPDSGVLPISGTPQFAVLTDPLLSQAADGPTAAPNPTGPGGAAPTSSPAGTDTPLSTQDTIGALAFRARTRTGSDGPLVLAPPHRWAADGIGAGALLDAAGELIAAGELTPAPPGSVLTTAPPADTPSRPVVYPLTAGGTEIPAGVVATIRATAAAVADLRSAVVPGTGVGIGTDQVFAPLTTGLVRPAAATLRGAPAAAAAAAGAGATRINDVRATVRVLEPPSPYSLGTSDAPLPLTVANGLPVTVAVRIRITSTSGLRVAPIAPVQIPPLGRRQVSLSAQVTRSGQFTVDAAVLTPAGRALGPPSRLKVSSTVYGTITVWLTVGAGILLVVLVIRRMVRRIRGAPRPGRPRPEPALDEPTLPTPLDPLPRPPPPGRGTPATAHSPVTTNALPVRNLPVRNLPMRPPPRPDRPRP